MATLLPSHVTPQLLYRPHINILISMVILLYSPQLFLEYLCFHVPFAYVSDAYRHGQTVRTSC